MLENLGQLHIVYRIPFLTAQSLSTEIIDSEGGRQATVGQLNSEWVTWLMGYPQGYLDISTENQNTSQELQQEKKTEPKS